MTDQEIYQTFKKNDLPDYIIINALLVKNNLITSFLINFKYYDNTYNDSKLFHHLEVITYNIKNLKICKFLKLNSYLVSFNDVIDTKCRTFEDIYKYNVLDYPINYEEINNGIKYLIKCNNIIIKSFSIKEEDEKTIGLNKKIKNIKTYIANTHFLKNIIFQIEKSNWFSKKYILQKLNIDAFKIESNKLLFQYLIYLLKINNFTKLNEYFKTNPSKINENKLLIKIIIGYIKTHINTSFINTFDEFMISQVN